MSAGLWQPAIGRQRMLISETHANTLRRNAIPSQIDAETDIGQLIRRGEINFIHPHKIIWYRSRYCREREREGSHREGGGEITGKHVTDTSKKEVTLFIKSFQKRSSLSCKENGANPSSSAYQASLGQSGIKHLALLCGFTAHAPASAGTK